MFKDEAHALEVIRRLCATEAADGLAPADVVLLRTRLRPGFWIEAAAEQPTGYRTQFGGAPALAPGTPWPMRPIEPDAHDMAAALRELTEARELLRETKRLDGVTAALLRAMVEENLRLASHMERELPFEFLAQIDLAEAAAHPAAAAGLPPQGRLCFFWDSVLGPHLEGASACRVIWDETPPDAVQPVPMPDVLRELEQQHAQSGIEALRRAIELANEMGRSPARLQKDLDSLSAKPRRGGKPFVHPRRAMRLTPILHLPWIGALEADMDDGLARLLKRGGEDCYRRLTKMDMGPFEPMDAGTRRQRLLGTPDPDQADPRFDVIDTGAYEDEAWWAEDNIADARRRAAEWRLLLQLDLADLDRCVDDGTLYFLIRAHDLAQQDFSAVRAVYQRT